MASLVIAILGLVLSMAGYAVSETTQGVGNDVRGRLTNIANKLYSKISSNNRMLDQMYQAYSQRDANYANSLIANAGFGPAMIALRKAQDKNLKEYKSKKDEVSKQTTTLTNKYNEANQAINNVGGSIMGTIGASKVADQLDQYVQGGLQSEEE